ncbi:MAG TPA: VOC family protein [Thermoleophilaceae bacterium]|nr:VOC family protein [Thermoleophilaceae bacterium]
MIDHVGLSVGSLDAAAAFYASAFGFEREFAFELPQGIRGLMLLHPLGSRLELFEHPESAAGLQGAVPLEALGTRGYGHFAWAAPDIRAAYEQALLAGATSVAEPGSSPEPGVLFAFLADPEGNLIELLQRP